MYKLCVYVPVEALEQVKSSLFAAGAGRIGCYDSCCWQVKGMGQFRPLDGSAPYLGQQGMVEQVEEYRVELVCDNEHIHAAVEALRASHPYEEPAFDVWQLCDIA